MAALVSKMRWRMKRLNGEDFTRNASGVAALEFAFIVVPFLGLLFAIMQIGLFFFYTSQIQMAAEIASRKIMTGTIAQGETVNSFITSELCQRGGLLNGLFDCSKLRVDIGSPDSWNGADMANEYENLNADRAAALNPPAPGRIAILRVGYPLPEFFSLFGIDSSGEARQITEGTQIYNGKRVRMIMGIAAFRVEQ